MSFFDIISVGGIRRSRRLVLDDLRSGARAAEQPVPGMADCTASLLDIEAAALFERDWAELAEQAQERNFCYEPPFAIAAARHLREARGVRFLFIWHRGASGRPLLIGCFPVMARGATLGPALLRGWSNPQISSGTPLLHAAHAETAVAAFLAVIAGQAAAPAAVLFPFILTDGAFAAVLQAVTGVAPQPFSAHARAMLSLDGPTDRGISSKKRKELRRQHNRLAEQGALTTTVATGEAVRGALERFMALEAAGWKGRAGTAFIQDSARAAFLRAAARGFAAQDRLSIESLELDGKLLASGLLVGAGRKASYWKVTYDEAYAAWSPGVQLTLGLAARVQAEGRFDSIDSCAIGDHPMIDHLWRDRLAMADLMIPVVPRHSFRFGLLRARESARRDLRARIKNTVYRLQGRTPS